MELKFRELRADEIECRVAQISLDNTKKPKGLSLLLYKDARCDMNILDETLGVLGWQRDHKELKGNIYCGVSVYDKEKQMWITKWDCGKESFTESEKGESSDSFKRACFNLGIGRSLYTAPFIWVKAEDTDIYQAPNGKLSCKDNFRVKDIGYKDGVITYLTIEGDKGVIFTYGKKESTKKQTTKKEEPKKEEVKDDSRLIPVLNELRRIGYTTNSILKTYKINAICEMTDEMIKHFLEGAKNVPSKEAS